MVDTRANVRHAGTAGAEIEHVTLPEIAGGDWRVAMQERNNIEFANSEHSSASPSRTSPVAPEQKARL